MKYFREFFIIFLIASHGAYAQVFPSPDYIQIKWYTLDEGLSQVTINDLIQDQDGFVWIGTQDGLNRFDGNEFDHFMYNEKDSNSIHGNHISKLLEDSKGRIWIGTIGNGVGFYEKNQEQFTRIKLIHSVNSNEVITGIVEDANHNIWLSSLHSGLHKMIEQVNGDFLQEHFLSAHQINALYLSDHDALWVGCYDGHVLKFMVGSSPKRQLYNFTVDGQVLSLIEWNDQLLIGSDQGLYKYDTNDGNLNLIKLEDNNPLPTRYVADFMFENDQEVWVATGAGLYLYNLKKYFTRKRIFYAENAEIGLSNNTIQSLLRIDDNQILVGTANYLNQVKFNPGVFQNISKNLRGQHILNDNVIFSILKDRNYLWVGTSDGGLNLITDEQIFYFTEDKNNPHSLSGMVVRSIVKDVERNRIWIATTRGLSMIDLENFDPNFPIFKKFQHDPNNKYSIANDFVKDIEVDPEGTVWGVTYGNGLFSLSLKSDGIAEIHNYQQDEFSILSNFIHCISQDNKGNLWLGSQEGLTKIRSDKTNLKNLHITNYTKEENGLSHSTVYDVIADNQNRIWVGTRYGLNLLLEDDTFQSWGEQDQFPNAVIYSIQADNHGKLWLATNDGIVNFNPTNNRFIHYNDEDGIQGKEFDLHAKFKDDDGIIYLGGVAGLTIFNPDDLNKIDHPERLYFSQLKIKDMIISPHSGKGSVLNQSIAETESIKIKSNQFPFYLKFSSIDFRMNKNVDFAYQLLPTNTEWNPLDHHEIQFLNLAPGEYSLKVNGFSRGEEWSQDPIAMNIYVLPPWWRTSIAILAYILVFFSLIYWVYGFQLSRRLALSESKKLKEINDLKNTLYTNITHEFRTPLTVIQGTSRLIESSLNPQQINDLHNHFETIQRNSNILLQLVNQLLDLDKIDQGKKEIRPIQSNIIPYLRYLHRSFQSLAASRSLQYVFYSERDELIMDFDSDIIFQIVSNLLSNAIKFTPAGGEIILHCREKLEQEIPELQLIIKDTGIGIQAHEIPKVFDRFYQVDTSSTRKFEGTGIGLALVKELVELIGGRVLVESMPNSGSSFIVNIPITNIAPMGVSAMHTESQNIMIQKNIDYDDQIPTPIEESDLPIALIIEDNRDLISYVEACLHDHYQVISATDGMEGIKSALSIIPDIIISDIMMPLKDGYQVCEHLKNEEKTSHIPIILLTAKTSERDKLKGLACGADAFISKPFKEEELMVRMEQMIKLRARLKKKFAHNMIHYKDKVFDDKEAKFLKRAIQMIEESIADAHFSGAVLAKKLGYSESQLYRKLKALTNRSTAVFIRSIRLSKAKALLEAGTHNVSEACYDVGFNDPAWFSKSFKKEFGTPPSSI